MDLQQNVEFRQQQHQSKLLDIDSRVSDDDDDEDEEEGESGGTHDESGKQPTTRQTMRQGGTLIFTRKHGEKGGVRL